MRPGQGGGQYAISMGGCSLPELPRVPGGRADVSDWERRRTAAAPVDRRAENDHSAG